MDNLETSAEPPADSESNAADAQEPQPPSPRAPTEIAAAESIEALAFQSESRAASIIQNAWRARQSKESLADNTVADIQPEPEVIGDSETKSVDAFEHTDEHIVPSVEPENQLNVTMEYIPLDPPEEKPTEQHFSSKEEEVNTVEFPDLSQWYKKRYMGGFTNKQTGQVFFHAQTNTTTPQEIKDATAQPKFHRDTQTKFLRNRLNQPRRESFTQMDKSGCHISGVYDYTLQPRPYFTSEMRESMLHKKATVIQCFVRKCFAIRFARKLRKERELRVKAMAAKEKRRVALEDKKRKKEIESRLHPKTNKDFEILYNGLEHWRIQETDTINNAGYSEPARLAALADLMDQEAALIQKIDRLKISANAENHEKSIVRLLEKMASPKRWPVLKGEAAVLVDTPNTIRARELRDLYHALNVSLLSIDERLQILLHVKYTVKEFDCVLTREIVELINREGDLVSRGRDAKSLEGLKKRISNLFLQFIQTPEFNPEAAVYQKFPDAGQSWKRDQAVYYCRGCTKYLPSTEFYLSTTLTHLGRCKPCTIKENIANQRKDDSCYADLLRSMRKEEAHKRPLLGSLEDANYNAIALLQETDMRHLIDVIWNRQSCISAAKNMDDLVMTRWDASMELSPWNCILLTKSEAEKHDQQSSPLDLYTDDFIRKIKQKHLASRRHFSQLPAMERYLRRHYQEDVEGRLVMRAQ
ncbi:hypothetical protein BJ741DRAFT_550779 [Chytriomyces cf. hyalinus JEL632]|nr:hypothetical protein BJ741DRAFT_550779 [Chytriomyces cf. hyalinus JEL632]